MTEQEGFINCLKKYHIIDDKDKAALGFEKGPFVIQLRQCDKNNISDNIDAHWAHCNNIRPTNVKDISVQILYKGLRINKIGIPDYTDYNFVIIFTGTDKKKVECDEKKVEYKCSWHLDYEPKSKNDELDEPKVFHPLFHLTYGGSTMRNIYTPLDDNNKYMVVKDLAINEETGCSFIPLYMISPRIPFPPMDYYLGIDFIICNFMDKRMYQKLQTETYYKRVIKNSQDALWKPYFMEMAKYWNGTTNTAHSLNQCLVAK